jgi:hypothetical protein
VTGAPTLNWDKETRTPWQPARGDHHLADQKGAPRHGA